MHRFDIYRNNYLTFYFTSLCKTGNRGHLNLQFETQNNSVIDFMTYFKNLLETYKAYICLNCHLLLF